MDDARLAGIEMFLQRAGWADARRTPLAGDASARRYLRLARGADSAVLMDADPAQGEGVARFVMVGAWLRARGYSAPRVLAADESQGLLLLEDLGDGLFARLIQADPSREQGLYDLAMRFLADLHQHPAPDWAVLHDGAVLGGLTLLMDRFYLPAHGARASAASLTAPAFAALYDRLNDMPPVLSLRDFHAENLVFLPKRTGLSQAGLLDFQDAMATHPAYDLVSLLQDARRDVPPGLERDIIAAYCSQRGLDADRFGAVYATLGAQRALRILAIFAKLCVQDGKPRYLDFMPRVWGYLTRNLDHPALGDFATTVRATIPVPDIGAIIRFSDHASA